MSVLLTAARCALFLTMNGMGGRDIDMIWSVDMIRSMVTVSYTHLMFHIARWGTHEDVAKAVRAFCSDDFCYTTGNYIAVSYTHLIVLQWAATPMQRHVSVI